MDDQGSCEEPREKVEKPIKVNQEQSGYEDDRTVKMVIGEPQKEEAQKYEKIGIEENISEVGEVIEECMGGDIQVGTVICPLYDVVKNRDDRVVKEAIDEMLERQDRWHWEDKL